MIKFYTKLTYFTVRGLNFLYESGLFWEPRCAEDMYLFTVQINLFIQVDPDFMACGWTEACAIYVFVQCLIHMMYVDVYNVKHQQRMWIEGNKRSKEKKKKKVSVSPKHTLCSWIVTGSWFHYKWCFFWKKTTRGPRHLTFIRKY